MVEAYFDDFKVDHIKSPVIQSDDYYPFGLRFNSYARENSVPNKTKLFQGQEHIDDLGLNWDSFKWRNHQPDIGRFFNIDPLAEKYYYNSPYAFSENKVVAHRELEGLESSPVNCPECDGRGSNSIRKDEGADRFFKGVVSTSKEVGKQIATSSDVNDATVLATTITRGGDAVNVDGSKATKSDKVFAAVGAVVPGISGSLLKKGITIIENAIKGKQFEKVVTQGLKDAGHTNVAEQVTVRPNGATSNVRLDNMSTQNDAIKLTDAKSSATAGFTPNQTTGYPLLQQNGGVVVGNNGAAFGFPAGTQIPPTKVDIVRPLDPN